MFRNKKALREAQTDEVVRAIQLTFPNLWNLETGVEGCSVTGLTAGVAKQGDGYLSILKLHLDERAVRSEMFPVDRTGHYVIYGFGETPLEALANIEAQLVLGEASLSPDKYAPKGT